MPHSREGRCPDVVPNVPDPFGSIGVRTIGGGRGVRDSGRKPGYCSYPRREETIRDAEDSVPPRGWCGEIVRRFATCDATVRSTPGRDVVQDVVPSLILWAVLAFVQLVADVAQEAAGGNPVIVCSRAAKKRLGTLRTASLPIDGVARLFVGPGRAQPFVQPMATAPGKDVV